MTWASSGNFKAISSSLSFGGGIGEGGVSDPKCNQ